MRLNYAIVFVSDMKRSVGFYRDVLGLPLKFESPGWTEFAIEGATSWSRGGRSIYFRDPDGHLLELATPGLWSVY